MPPSPESSQQPVVPERPGSLLEIDDDALDDVLQSFRSKLDVELVPLTPKEEQPAASKVEQPAASPAKAPIGASPYLPMQRPPLALLTVLDDGKRDGEVVRLRTDRFVIGRSEGDFLIPHDQQISARHIEITRKRVGDKYRWMVTDLQSSNGLFIRVSRAVLADKAEFLAGTAYYRFEAPSSNLPETVDAVSPDAPRGSTRPLGVDPATLLPPALVELVGGKVLSRLPLAKPEYWIGSDSACAICRTGDPFLEPRHVRLYREANGVWQAQNNKTVNGLWLKMPQITVTESCSFQIGEQRFRLNAGG